MNKVLVDFNEFKINVFDNDAMGRIIKDGTWWEPHIIRFLEDNLTKDSVFLDVGSNYGWHSIIASKYCNSVYSFEPQKVMFELQKESIIENNITNIDVHNIAIGNTVSYMEMASINYDQDGVNIGDLSIGLGGEKVFVATIDLLDFTQIDMIKIDVQGYEKFVLEGAIESIKKYKPILIVEVEGFQLEKFGYGDWELFNYIRSLDYEIYYLEYVYPSDHVCVHKSQVEEFEKKNNVQVLDYNNTLNRNLHNGVTKKIPV